MRGVYIKVRRGCLEEQLAAYDFLLPFADFVAYNRNDVEKFYEVVEVVSIGAGGDLL